MIDPKRNRPSSRTSIKVEECGNSNDVEQHPSGHVPFPSHDENQAKLNAVDRDDHDER